MKKLATIIFAFALVANAKAQGIQFENKLTWEQVKEKAKREDKYIFMDAYATWCIPCKEMDAKTFPKENVAQFVNDNFVSVKVQMDKAKNDSERIKEWYTDATEIGIKYEVNAFPTILVFTSSAELIGKILGLRDADQLIADTKKILEDNHAFELKYQAYLNGKKDSTEVNMIIAEAKKAGRSELAHSIAEHYINTLEDSELFEASNLMFIYLNTSKSTDKGFELFRTYASKADRILGKKFQNASKKLTDRIIFGEEIEPYFKSRNVDWEKIIDNINTKYGELDKEYYYGIRMIYASDNKLWSEFGKYYALYYKTAFNHSIYHINNISWRIVQHINDPKILAIAIRTMKYNNEYYDKDNPDSWDTYANLLYKAGRKAEAIAAQEKAITLSQNAKGFVETLKKMKANIKIW